MQTSQGAIVSSNQEMNINRIESPKFLEFSPVSRPSPRGAIYAQTGVATLAARAHKQTTPYLATTYFFKPCFQVSVNWPPERPQCN